MAVERLGDVADDDPWADTVVSSNSRASNGGVNAEQPLFSHSPSDAVPLPPSHGAEGSPPLPHSMVSNSAGHLGGLPVPTFFSDWNGRVSSYMERLPHSTSRNLQAVIAAASSAVHDPEAESAAGSFYFTPLPDCCSLDRLVFTPGGGSLDPVPTASLAAAQKTTALGIFLIVVGILMMLFPSFPTSALVLVAGACLLVAGIVTLVSFILTLPAPASYVFLFLAIFHIWAGFYMLFNPIMAASWLCIIIAAWLVAKAVGRLSAWRNFHSLDGPPFWKVPHKSGLTLLVLGSALAIFSRYIPSLLGMLFGWDLFLTGLLLSAAGLHSLKSSGQPGLQDSDPLVQSGQQSVPSYTV